MKLLEAMDVNKNALLTLRKKYNTINLLDVGCARGSLLSYASRYFDNIYSVGIDPLNHSKPQYNHYLQCAIDDVEEIKIAKFYVNQDDQASSLLQMDFENISDKLEDKDSKYFIRWAKNLSVIGEIEIPVVSLKSVVDELMPTKVIHFLKIDAEGKDLDVIKSIKEHASRVLFVSLECSSHQNDSIRIFKQGCHINSILPFMDSIGFSIFEKFDCEEDPDNLTQMCDIVFVNKSFNI